MWRKCIKKYTDNQGNDSKTVAEGNHEDASHNSKRPLAITSKRQEKEEEVETTGKGGRSRKLCFAN